MANGCAGLAVVEQATYRAIEPLAVADGNIALDLNALAASWGGPKCFGGLDDGHNGAAKLE